MSRCLVEQPIIIRNGFGLRHYYRHLKSCFGLTFQQCINRDLLPIPIISQIRFKICGYHHVLLYYRISRGAISKTCRGCPTVCTK